MRIATMVRGILPVPRPADIMYSPLDVAITLSEELTKRGHDITYYGPKGTHLDVTHVRTRNLHPLVSSNAELQAIVNSPELFMSYVPSLYDHYLVEDMFKRAREGKYDLLHFHHPETALPFAKLYPDVPVVYTLHDQLNALRRETMEMYLSNNQHYISISNNQRRIAPDLPYAATVYNGIDTTLFDHDGAAEDYLLFVGRIVPDKGVKEAVQLALKTNSRLLIIGQTLATDQWYFDEHIKPFLSDKILYLGFIDHRQLVRYYQKARALVMAIQWEEPFGLSMIEAMACGTPVIAMRRGSVPEIIVDGKTGYISDSLSGMVASVKKLDKISREDCREHVLEHFSVEKMIDHYESTFENIMRQHSRSAGQRGRELVAKLKKVSLPKLKSVPRKSNQQLNLTFEQLIKEMSEDDNESKAEA